MEHKNVYSSSTSVAMKSLTAVTTLHVMAENMQWNISQTVPENITSSCCQYNEKWTKDVGSVL